jgi:diguanylate cyclase (GGDEF)-like protein
LPVVKRPTVSSTDDELVAVDEAAAGQVSVLWSGREASSFDRQAVERLLADQGFAIFNEVDERADVVLAECAHPADIAKLISACGARPAIVFASDADLPAIVGQGVFDVITPANVPRLPATLRHAVETARAQERIERLAGTDPLTGLANRNAFVVAVEHAVADGRRRLDGFAVHYLDLDNFKDVNDTFGHLTGDRVLMAVADRLRQAVRETDVVARLGGDEFAVLQTGLREPADAGTVAAKLLASLDTPVRIGATECLVNASVGIALNNAGELEAEETINQADTALYRAKDEGRARYCFFAPGLDQQVRERVSLAEELRGALQRKDFVIHYQPIISLPDCRIVGLEALLRWKHSRRGIVAPSAFLLAASKAGLTPAIDLWMLEQVCARIGEWRDAGVPVVKIAVNIGHAPVSRSREFIEGLSEVLRHSGVSPKLLDFEIAEVPLADMTVAPGVELERLQRLGVRMVIDRFGAGPMSLERIGVSGVGRIKIAPRLVAGGVQGGREAALLRAAVILAREMGISVVATGVENERQLAAVIEAGCTLVQGFHICRPLPPEEIEPLLRRGRIDVQIPQNARQADATASLAMHAAQSAAHMQRRLQAEIARQIDRLPLPVCVVERRSGRVLVANQAIAAMLDGQVGGLHRLDDVWEAAIVHAVARQALRERIEIDLHGNLLQHAGEPSSPVPMLLAGGRVGAVDVRVTRCDHLAVVALFDPSGNHARSNVAPAQETVDDLTDFIDRRLMFDHVSLAISSAVALEEKLALIIVRFEGLEAQEAQFGRAMVERVLMAVPSVLAPRLRQGDVVGRASASEFMILAPRTDAEGVRVLADRLCEVLLAVRAPTPDGRALTLTCSYGVAELEAGETGFDNLMVRADTALHAARMASGAAGAENISGHAP